VILRRADFDKAQEAKEEIEVLQRNDRKLRAACVERREMGGHKFAMMAS